MGLVWVSCVTLVENILRVLELPMKDFNEGLRQDLSVATLAQAVTFRFRHRFRLRLSRPQN